MIFPPTNHIAFRAFNLLQIGNKDIARAKIPARFKNRISMPHIYFRALQAESALWIVTNLIRENCHESFTRDCDKIQYRRVKIHFVVED